MLQYSGKTDERKSSRYLELLSMEMVENAKLRKGLDGTKQWALRLSNDVSVIIRNEQLQTTVSERDQAREESLVLLEQVEQVKSDLAQMKVEAAQCNAR